MSTPDPLDSAIPVGSGPGTTVPPSSSSPNPGSTPPPPPPPFASTPPPATPPVEKPRGSDKIWALVAHLSGFVGLPILLPAIVYLAMKDDSAYVADNAREALNFHISWIIYSLCAFALSFILIGMPILFLLWIAGLVLAVIAALKAADGGCYRYPLTIRLIK